MRTCALCGKSIESHETITVVDAGDRCYPCFNREMAEELGIDFDDTPLQPIVLADADGVPHTFGIRSMLAATGHELVAEESPRPDRGGCRFAVLGDVHADSWYLFQRLYEKMRREMVLRHVERATHGWQVEREQCLVGRLEWDSGTNGRVPLLVIDGRRFTWEEVGRMLMTFEGFTLHARIEELVDVPERNEDV